MSRISLSAIGGIDPSRDELLRLSQAAKLFPKVNGKAKPLATIYRHATKGCRGIRLDIYCDGGAVYTTQQAVERFLNQVCEARNQSLDPCELPNRKQSETTRTKAIAKATQNVDDMLAPKRKGK